MTNLVAYVTHTPGACCYLPSHSLMPGVYTEILQKPNNVPHKLVVGSWYPLSAVYAFCCSPVTQGYLQKTQEMCGFQVVSLTSPKKGTLETKPVGRLDLPSQDLHNLLQHHGRQAVLLRQLVACDPWLTEVERSILLLFAPKK